MDRDSGTFETTGRDESGLAFLAGEGHGEILPRAREAGTAFGRLYAIVARLRAPDGCPWDRAQTPVSLRGNIVEEAYELVEAIDEGDPDHVGEEAGDLYLLATMVAFMGEETGTGSVAAALDRVSAKLVRRHPHVFAESTADTPDKVVDQWNRIKENLEGRRPKDSLLDGVSRSLPPLERAYRLQKKAAAAGFDWEHEDAIWDKVVEEVEEARAEVRELARRATTGGDRDGPGSADVTAALESEMGDIIFSIVNVARRHGVDPGLALGRTVEKFCRRFRGVERRMADSGLACSPEHRELMDALWNEVKADER